MTDIDLNILRDKIDSLDHEIIKLIAQRFEIVKDVAEFKKKNNIQVVQSGRWQQVLQDRQKLAKELNIDTEMITEMWESIHKYAIILENQIKGL